MRLDDYLLAPPKSKRKWPDKEFRDGYKAAILRNEQVPKAEPDKIDDDAGFIRKLRREGFTEQEIKNLIETGFAK